jgi:hypothetical protein
MILRGEKMQKKTEKNTKVSLKRKHTKFIHEGKYVAEVEIEIINDEDGWSPYISLEDAQKLDTIRKLLKNENLSKAKQYAKVYILKPIAA